MVFGTIYETNIPTVSLSHESKADYFNRKQCYNSNTQVVAVADPIFHFVSAGFPESPHNSGAFRKSFVYKLENGDLPGNQIEINFNPR